jgi:transcription initiation factor IIE alpha subunit
MRKPTDEEIVGLLVQIISDGFNRSLRALSEEGAIDTRKLRSEYTGVGSKYYDLVTEKITYTATWAAPEIRLLFEKSGEQDNQQKK